MQSMTRFVEAIIFNSRWLVAPFLLGLVVGLAALALKFLIKLADFVMQIPTVPPADVIVGILTLVDLTLIANLIVIVICSSYENFLTHIDPPNIQTGRRLHCRRCWRDGWGRVRCW